MRVSAIASTGQATVIHLSNTVPSTNSGKITADENRDHVSILLRQIGGNAHQSKCPALFDLAVVRGAIPVTGGHQAHQKTSIANRGIIISTNPGNFVPPVSLSS
jgi:hypothetical protein